MRPFPQKYRKILAAAVENWPAKAISIALAVILFVYYRQSQLESRFFSLPLRVETGAALAPASAYTRNIRITLRGEKNDIDPIKEEDMAVFIDLSACTSPGTYKAPVQIRREGSALGVEALQIQMDPLEIVLDLDQRLSKYVPLQARTRGFLEPGYELSSSILDPKEVVIDGPQKLVSSITRMDTEEVELSGRNEDFTLSLKIRNADPLITIRGSGYTEFRGKIRELVMTENIAHIPIRLVGLGEMFEARPDVGEGAVRVEGSQSAFEAGRPVQAVLEADCLSIEAPGEYTLPVTVRVPPEFTLVRSEPETVTLQVRVKR